MPVFDIGTAVSGASDSLAIQYSTIRREIGRLLGWPRDPDGTPPWTSDQVLDCDDMIAAGLRQFYAPPIMDNDSRAHRWSFLIGKATFTTSDPYSTGTVAVADGVVTLTDGTFPSWAASGELVVGGNVYRVASRGSDTQLTLSDTTVDVDAGESYTLVRVSYDLPADFTGMYGDLTYRPQNTIPGVYRMQEIAEDQLRAMYVPYSNQADKPQWFAVRPKASTGTAEQRHEIELQPRADAAYEVAYRYSLRASMIGANSPYPLGGTEHGETILQSCLAIAELKMQDRLGEHHQKFLERLKASIEKDRAETASDTLGRDYGTLQDCDWLDGFNALRASNIITVQGIRQ